MYMYGNTESALYTDDVFLPNFVGIKYSWPPHICIDFMVKSTQGWIQGGAKIGHRSPFSKGLLQRLKAIETNQMYSNDLKSFREQVLLFLVPF